MVHLVAPADRLQLTDFGRLLLAPVGLGSCFREWPKTGVVVGCSEVSYRQKLTLERSVSDVRYGPRMQHWSEQPCVRPLDAVHMTAGHNALRGSGPGQKDAFDDAMARVGCPRSPDRPALHYVLFALPTFTSRRRSGAISFTPQARRVLCIARPWPSWPRPSGRACWRARWPRPWWVAAPATR